jgi:hypothetical protein
MLRASDSQDVIATEVAHGLEHGQRRLVTDSTRDRQIDRVHATELATADHLGRGLAAWGAELG